MVEEQPLDVREQAIRDLRPPGIPHTTVDCIVPETGEMFTAEIAKSNRFPSGRIVNLIKFSYPPGFVPDTLPRNPDDPVRKQWIYENHYKKLLQQFVGKPASVLGVFRKDMQEKIRKALAEVGV